MYDIAAIGEVLFDRFSDRQCPGGAAANVAVIGAENGLNTILISAVGNDADGRELLTQLEKFHVDTTATAVIERPTGIVNVTVCNGMPSYEICLNSAWDHIPLSPAAVQAAADARTLVFGSLAQRSEVSRDTIMQLLISNPRAWKVFDINIRQNFYSAELISASLDAADTLKISEEELPTVARCLGLSDNGEKFAAQIMEKFSLTEIILTRGENGAEIFAADEHVTVPAHCAGKLVDTVGAGDAFLAGYIQSRLNGKSRYDSAMHAAEIAGLICTVAGAWTKLPQKKQG